MNVTIQSLVAACVFVFVLFAIHVEKHRQLNQAIDDGNQELAQRVRELEHQARDEANSAAFLRSVDRLPVPIAMTAGPHWVPGMAFVEFRFNGGELLLTFTDSTLTWALATDEAHGGVNRTGEVR